jgi:hypothetical protein
MKVKVQALTKHFKEEWRERVGTDVPSVGLVRKLIEESVFLQKGMPYHLFSGEYYHKPGLYWHVERALVLKLDEVEMTAISVFSPRLAPGCGQLRVKSEE